MNKTCCVTVSILALSGCITTSKPTPSPPQNSVIMCPHIGFPLIIPEGFFDDPNNWMSEEGFARLIEEEGEKQETRR